MRARFLNDREKQGTRAFYESAFPEDSEEFVDFYYKWNVGRNDILSHIHISEPTRLQLNGDGQR